MDAASFERMMHQKAIKEANTSRGKFSHILKNITNFELIDGDVFLNSEDWPHLWRTNNKSSEKRAGGTKNA